ncbi:unnamed protein product [Lactuca saligna]|uniref:TTF-type domain-containing protein n=1 Tax=Lactuca saligna TaxID=75948 RepID=A0AA36A1Y1_LACSI|nr:unnamed protein product [Lactuca saligna]
MTSCSVLTILHQLIIPGLASLFDRSSINIQQSASRVKQVKLSGFFTKTQRPNPNESGEECGEECSQIPITKQSIPSVPNSNATPQTPITNQSIPFISNATPQTPCSNQPNDNVDLKDLPKDPSDRPKITSYKSNIRDEVRRVYFLQGPCQVRAHKFPIKNSVKKNSAYCLYCYVYGDLMGQKGGRYEFVSQGFDTWNKKKDAFLTHMGGVDSFHNKEKEKFEFLMREKQASNVVLKRQTEAEEHKYKARLRVSIIVVKLLLKTGLPFRGHDESVNSENRGLYIEVLKAIRETSEDIFNNKLENAPKNNQLISPNIQKELVQCFAQQVLLSIREEIGQDIFG